MHKEYSTLQIGIYLLNVFVLIVGLIGSAVVFSKAADDSNDTVGYEVVGGNVYVIAAAESKRYRHDLELFGGKAAVLADDFNRGFAGLWQGRWLGYTRRCWPLALL